MFTAIFILVAIVSVVALLVILMNSGARNERRALVKRFEQAIIDNQLTIDEKEVFRQRIIGIDRVNKKLLFVEQNGSSMVVHCLGLEQMARCRVVQHSGDEVNDVPDSHLLNDSRLQRISLECKHLSGDMGVNYLTFYDQVGNSLYEMRELVSKAFHWKQKIVLCRPDPSSRKLA